MNYVDGFVLPVPRKKVEAYLKIARKAGKVWKDHGALEYRECVGDDLEIKGVVSFLKLAKAKPDETVIFAWIVYKSRAHRDKVNAKVMQDPRIAAMGTEEMPFDMEAVGMWRLSDDGFELIRQID